MTLLKDILQIDDRKYMTQLVICAILVLSLALHYLMLGKDSSLANQIIQDLNITYETYLTGLLGSLLQSSIIPVLYVLYLSYAKAKSVYSKLAKSLWTILLATSFFLTLFSSQFFSLFILIALIAQVMMLIINHRFKGKETSYEASR